jgi:hypothetical protein
MYNSWASVECDSTAEGGKALTTEEGGVKGEGVEYTGSGR